MQRKTKAIISLLLAITLLVSLQGSFANDSEPNDSELTKYNLQVTYDDTEKTLKTKQVVKFTNFYDESLEKLVLHLYPDSYGSLDTMPAIGGVRVQQNEKMLPKSMFGDIDILDVKINNKGVEFTEDNQILKINLDRELKAGKSIEIYIDFKLDMPEGRHRLGYYENVISLTNWYPLMSIYNPEEDTWDENPYHPVGESNYSNVADYKVTFDVPKDMEIASTGVDVGIENNNKRKSVVVEATKVRDFVVMMSKDYKKVSQEIDGITINSFYLTSDESHEIEKQNGEILLEVVSDTVKFFNETVGKYPYKELDITETYLSGGAMEYPQLIQMGKYGSIDKDYKEKNAVNFLIEAAVHEAIHQWWYVSVGNNEYEEPFMDESMTVHSTAYYFEKQFGKYHENGAFMKIKSRVYPYRGTPFASNVDEFRDWRNYVQSIYGRGPIVIEDLRNQVGEDKFVEILRTYYDRYLLKNGSIKGFIEVVEEIGGTEVKGKIEEAITSKSYFPENLALTQDEEMELRRQSEMANFREREERVGMHFGSMFLKGLEGNKIYITVPDSMIPINDSGKAVEKAQTAEMLLAMMVRNFENKNIEFEIIKESELKENQLSENIIMLGNMKDSELMDEFKGHFPVRRVSKWLMIDGITIKSKNTHGAFIMENPYNGESLTMVIFWDNEKVLENNYYGYTNMWNESNQFKIGIGDTKQVTGRY